MREERTERAGHAGQQHEWDSQQRWGCRRPQRPGREAEPDWALGSAGSVARRGSSLEEFQNRSWLSRLGVAGSPPSTRRASWPRRSACTRPGEVGELLRREGLYTSHLTYWRKRRKEGALKELGQARGRKPADKRDAQIAALTRRAERAECELVKMKRVVEIQGNVSALLEEMLGQGSAQKSTER